MIKNNQETQGRIGIEDSYSNEDSDNGEDDSAGDSGDDAGIVEKNYELSPVIVPDGFSGHLQSVVRAQQFVPQHMAMMAAQNGYNAAAPVQPCTNAEFWNPLYPLGYHDTQYYQQWWD